MRITLTATELKQALADFIEKKGFQIEGGLDSIEVHEERNESEAWYDIEATAPINSEEKY